MRVFSSSFVVSVLILLVAAACSQGSLSEGQRAEVEAVVSSEGRRVTEEVSALLVEHWGRVNGRIEEFYDDTGEALSEHYTQIGDEVRAELDASIVEYNGALELYRGQRDDALGVAGRGTVGVRSGYQGGGARVLRGRAGGGEHER